MLKFYPNKISFRLICLFLLVFIKPYYTEAQKTTSKKNVPGKPAGPAVSTTSLKDVNGKIFPLKNLKENEVSVVIFLSPECPLCLHYTLPLKDLENSFAGGNVKFYGVFPGKDYDAGTIKDYAARYQLTFPLLLDPDYKLTRSLKATVTPEVFVLDSALKTQYSGAIDNEFVSVGKKRKVVTDHYLMNALVNVLNKQPLKITKTTAIGCIMEPAAEE